MSFSSTLAFLAVVLLSTVCHAQAGTMFAMNVGAAKEGRFISEKYEWLKKGGIRATDPFKATLPGVTPIYSSHRFGKPHFTAEWGYDIPFEIPGMYICTAHFGENSPRVSKVGDRVFDLSFASGTAAPIVFTDIDVYKIAPVTKIHTVKTPIMIEGTLKIRLKKAGGSANGAFISAIECTKKTGPVPVDPLPIVQQPITIEDLIPASPEPSYEPMV